jgi:hypothetical protein
MESQTRRSAPHFCLIFQNAHRFQHNRVWAKGTKCYVLKCI